MPAITLQQAEKFPNGTTVSARPESGQAPIELLSPPSAGRGAFRQAAAVTAVSANGTVALPSMPSGRYFAHAVVGGQDRFVRFVV